MNKLVEKYIRLVIKNRDILSDKWSDTPGAISIENLNYLWEGPKTHKVNEFIRAISLLDYKYITSANLTFMWNSINSERSRMILIKLSEKIKHDELYDKNVVKNILAYMGPE